VKGPIEETLKLLPCVSSPKVLQIINLANMI